jgi:hypothetical protein
MHMLSAETVLAHHLVIANFFGVKATLNSD